MGTEPIPSVWGVLICLVSVLPLSAPFLGGNAPTSKPPGDCLTTDLCELGGALTGPDPASQSRVEWEQVAGLPCPHILDSFLHSSSVGRPFRFCQFY